MRASGMGLCVSFASLSVCGDDGWGRSHTFVETCERDSGSLARTRIACHRSFGFPRRHGCERACFSRLHLTSCARRWSAYGFHRLRAFKLPRAFSGPSALREGRSIAQVFPEHVAHVERARFILIRAHAYFPRPSPTQIQLLCAFSGDEVHAEPRVSIYGRNKDEWTKLAEWFVDYGFADPERGYRKRVTWLVQVCVKNCVSFSLLSCTSRCFVSDWIQRRVGRARGVICGLSVRGPGEGGTASESPGWFRYVWVKLCRFLPSLVQYLAASQLLFVSSWAQRRCTGANLCGRKLTLKCRACFTCSARRALFSCSANASTTSSAPSSSAQHRMSTNFTAVYDALTTGLLHWQNMH